VPAKIVVTGAAGFVGSHLVDRLLGDGHDVLGIDSFEDYYPRALKEANLRDAAQQPGFRLLEANLLNLGSANLAELFYGAAAVYHLAAQAGVRRSWGDSFAVYTDNNVLGTQMVLEGVKTAAGSEPDSIPLVYASSSSVYGAVAELPYREDGPCRPMSPYGVTKLAGEHLLQLYHGAYGLHTVSLRFFTVFGPRQRPDMAFNIFIRALLEGRPLDVFGGGEQTRDFTYVSDIIAALLAAPSAPGGSVINVGGGERVTLNHVLDALERLTGTQTLREHSPKQTGDMPHTWADLTRARRLLNYRPQVSLREGLAAEVRWLSCLPEQLRVLAA
jgi:nucleoside-diphosphate-sugar epimerase